MKKTLTFILTVFLFILCNAQVFAISPKTQFPNEEKVALSLIADLLDATSLDFTPPKKDVQTTKETIIRTKHKNPYRNIFYYYGLIYGSLSPIGSSYRTVYNNFLSRSAYSMPVQKVSKSQQPRDIKRFDLIFPYQNNNFNISPQKNALQKKDEFVPGEALTILDLMQEEFESTFFTTTTEQTTTKLNILKKAIQLLNKSLSQKQQSRAIAAYENNSSSFKSQKNLFIIRAFIQTMINKMENKLNIPYNQNVLQKIRASA